MARLETSGEACVYQAWSVDWGRKYDSREATEGIAVKRANGKDRTETMRAMTVADADTVVETLRQQPR